MVTSDQGYLLNFIQITVDVISRTRWVSVFSVFLNFLLKKELKLGKVGKRCLVLTRQKGHQGWKLVIQLSR